jgi:hypothetical protein
MKRINIIYLFLMLAVFGSCLDEDPKYTTNSKVVYSDEQSAQMALTGIYGLMAVQGSFAQLLPGLLIIPPITVASILQELFLLKMNLIILYGVRFIRLLRTVIFL